MEILNELSVLDKAIKDKIVILPELKNYIAPLSAEESSQLEENILAEGVRNPILLWKNTWWNYYQFGGTLPHGLETKSDDKRVCYFLIDGHNRYQICQKHNLDFPYKIMEFESIEAVKLYMVNEQLGRRNTTPEYQAYLRGQQKILYGLKWGGDRTASGQNVHLKSTAEIAKQHNVSEKTIQRDAEFANGLDVLPWELKQKVLSGKTRLDKATISNLPKALAKFPNFPIFDEVSVETLYQRYRESEALKPESLPKKSNIPQGKPQMETIKKEFKNFEKEEIPEHNQLLSIVEENKNLEAEVYKFYLAGKIIGIACTRKTYDFLGDYIKNIHEENRKLREELENLKKGNDMYVMLASKFEVQLRDYQRKEKETKNKK